MAKLYSRKKRKTADTLAKVVLTILCFHTVLSANLSGGGPAPHLIALQLIVFVSVTVILWLRCIPSTLAERIIHTAFLCGFVFPTVFLSFRTAVIVHLFLVLLVGFWVFFLMFIQKKDPQDIFSFSPILLLMLICTLAYRATYMKMLSSGISFRLFVIPLILGIAAGIFLSVKYVWHMPKFESKSKGERIALLLLCIFICSFSFCTLASNINYAFDTTEPQELVTVIEEKETYHSGSYRRHRTRTYRFSVSTNSASFSIDLPAAEYNSYDVGDTYVIHQYGGALGEPYYIPENLSE